MVWQLDTGTELGTVEVTVTRKRVKRINLRIKKDGKIVVSAPVFALKKEIVEFVKSNVPWIVRHLTKRQNYLTKEEEMTLIHNGKVRFFGNDYTVVFQEGETKVSIIGAFFVVSAMKDHQRVLDRWWRKEARKIFQQEIDELYEKIFLPLGVKRPDMTVKRMTSRWGSCNHVKGHINMNENLLRADRECIEYVVLHELTHLVYPDHSERFYAFIARYMPDYKRRIKKLKEVNSI